MNKLNQLTVVFLFVLFSIPQATKADSFSDFQLSRLNNPTERQYIAEASGRVYIYDGLTADQVDNALDNHFDRIDAMMFTRIIQTNKFGEMYAENDGCD